MPVPSSVADVIPDAAWHVISKHIPMKTSKTGARRLDDRVVIAGLVWTAANNLPLTRCPDSLDVSGHTLYQRKKRWQESGAWSHIEHAIRRTVLPGYRGN
jgi:transposase